MVNIDYNSLIDTDIESGPVATQVADQDHYSAHRPSPLVIPERPIINKKHFIANVFSFVSAQLFLNGGVISLVLLSKIYTDFVKSDNGIILGYTSAGLIAGISFSSLCCQRLIMKYPTNYIFYTMFTASLSYLFGILATVVNPHIIMLATVGTLMSTCTLVVFATQTYYDYNLILALQCVFSSLGVYLAIVITIFHLEIFQATILFLAMFLFMTYLVVNIQNMVDGQHIHFKFTDADYTTAALCLYLDIINIFYYLWLFCVIV